MYKLLQLQSTYLLKKKVLYRLFDLYIRSITVKYLLEFKKKKKRGLLGMLISISNKKYTFLRLLEHTYLSKVITHLNTCNSDNINYYTYYYSIVCTYLHYVFMCFKNKIMSNEVELFQSIDKLSSIYFHTVNVMCKRILLQNRAYTFTHYITPNRIKKENKSIFSTEYIYILLRLVKKKKQSSISVHSSIATTLFSITEFGPNVVDRLGLVYSTTSNYLCFLHNCITVKKYNYRYLYIYLMVLFNWHYFSSYYRLLRDEEWKLFGVYKKEVIKYHLN